MGEAIEQQVPNRLENQSASDPKDALIADLRDDLARRSDELREVVEDLVKVRRRLARVSEELHDVRIQSQSFETELHNIRVSVFWRGTAPARKFFERHPGAAVAFRRFAKLVYWTLKGRLFRELKARRARAGTALPVPVGDRPVKSAGIPQKLSQEKEARLLTSAMHPPHDVATVSSTEFSPKISLIVPTYNTPTRFLLELLESVRAQTYSNWQLCIADDGSRDESTKETIRRAAENDKRIRYVLCEKNQGIAKASMEAAKLADGDYISMLDHDDALAPGALSAVISAIRKNPSVDMFYTDHAMMSKEGELVSAALKPGWSPEFFLSTNYVVHFKTVRKALFDEVGGFEGTSDLYTDGGLILKLMRANAKIRHIPEIQYFWRMHEQSVSDSSSRKPGIIKAATDAVDSYLQWKGVTANSVWAPRLRQTGFGIYKLQFPEKPVEKITVVVPVWPDSRIDRSLLATFENTKWPGVGMVVVGIGCSVPTSRLAGAESVVVNNQAEFDALIRSMRSDAIVFVPCSAIFSSHDWLTEITGYLRVSEHIGAVGGKVLNPYLKTESGGVRLTEGLPTMSHNAVDTHHGYWFDNTITGNVEAVSLRLLATRKELIDEIGAPPVFEYDEDAGIAYCLRARRKGYRVVFNPWAKIVASRDRRPVRDTELKLATEFGADDLEDRYSHPEFERGN